MSAVVKKNPFSLSFHRDVKDRFNRDGADMTNGQWMCGNTFLNKKPFSFDRYPFQEQIANDMHPNLCCIKPSQVGLALDLDTPILTSQGWKTMGTLEVGEKVYDEQGKLCNVDYVSPIYLDRDCYSLTFDDDSTLVADGQHRWWVRGEKAFNNNGLYPKSGRIPKDSDYAREGIVNTEMLSKNFSMVKADGKKSNLFSIPNTRPLKIKSNPKITLPPYILGYWLGDGSNASASLTVDEYDILEVTNVLETLGYSVEQRRYKDRTTTLNFNKKGSLRNVDTAHKKLTDLGVIKNKHIPCEYLFSSKKDRLDLLSGLMDSDGSVTKRGRCSFYNTDPRLVDSVEFLIQSLGFKARTRWRKPSSVTLTSGHKINSTKMVGEVSFMCYSDTPVFKLDRKLKRLKVKGTKTRVTESLQRKIVNVEKVETRPVRCISVSSPSHLFLAGKALVPTHNTEIQIRKALTIMRRVDGRKLIYTMPNERMYKRISKTRILPIIEHDRAFRDVKKPAMDLIPIGTNFMYVTGSTEGDATSIDADYLFHDEVDLMPQGMMSLFSSRLQGSDVRIKQSFSTPKWDGYGIDLMYSSSDQHEYLIKCRSCNTHQIPQFTKEYVHIPGGCMDLVNDLSELDRKMVDSGQLQLDNIKVKCRKCHRPLNLADYDRREWVARHPQRTHSRGYRVRTFSTHRLDPKYIITELFKAQDKDNVAGWQNTVLGDTASTGDRRLSKTQISEQLKGQAHIDPPKGTGIYVGIDVGVTCNIVLGVSTNGIHGVQVFRMYTCPADGIVNEVKNLMEKYTILGGGMDKYPYTPTANDVREVSKGKIVPIEYNKSKEIIAEKDPFGQVTTAKVNRTVMLDYVANGIRKKSWELRGYGPQKETIITHLMDMVRDEPQEGQATWMKLNGTDHYFHALAYLAAGISYRDLHELLTGHESVADDPFEDNIFEDSYSEYSHCNDLVGYSSRPSSTKNIITRY